MVASRYRPKGLRYYGSFGLSVLAMTLVPRQIGYQDLVALLARQPDVSQRARAHFLASPFGTIHAATFSFPQPIGTMIPEPPRIRLASADPDSLEITGAIARDDTGALIALHRPRLDFPSVNRRLKGDLLVERPHAPPPVPDEGTRDLTPGRVKTVSFPRRSDALPDDEVASKTPAEPQAEIAAAPAVASAPAGEAPAVSEADVITAALTPADARKADDLVAERPDNSAEAVRPPRIKQAALDTGVSAKTWTGRVPIEASSGEEAPATYRLASVPQPARALPPPPSATEPLDPIDDADSAVRLTRLYFGSNPVGDSVGPIEPWPADEEVVILPPANDPDFKRSVVAPSTADEAGFEAAVAGLSSGETVAAKGEVTGPGKRPKTPAERLGLDSRQRVKSEKCLAEAVYFESRGEPKRGQIAVAQVVMNRVFSGFYPNNICGVVYQNANRKFACQFTFACDNVPDVVNEPDMWEQAKEIARDMLDGKLWLSEIGHSTHYHAYWVHPSWVGEMRKIYTIGVHKFYRPRAWGDTVEVPNYTFVPPGKHSDAEPKSKADEGKRAKL